MTARPLLVVLCLLATLVPGLALAQACPKMPTQISCPAGQEWDAASMLCLTPSV